MKSRIYYNFVELVRASVWLVGLGGSIVLADERAVPEALERQVLAQRLVGYEQQMDLVLDLLGDSDDAEAIERETRRLVDQSVPILDAFAARNEECAEYLEAAKSVLEQIGSIDVETIEEDFHDDGALPEAEGKCYHAKDLLVHPATVLVLLREEGLKEARESMIREIAENRAHLAVVLQSLK